MIDCIVIGDVTIDTFLMIDHAHLACDIHGKNCQICFDFGAKIPIKQSHQSIGGNAANVAAAITRLGKSTAIVTELGDDFNGHEAYEELAALGIDMQYARQGRGKETRYSVIVNFESDRTVFSYHAPRKYTFPRLDASPWIYYTSLSASFELIQSKLIKHLKQHKGTQLAVNPGSFQMHNGITELRNILPHIDILFVNKEEAAMLLNEKKPIKQLAKTLAEKGIATVVITDGEAGSYVYHETQLWHMPIYPLKPISKTGAGDAYAAAFLAAFMHGKDIKMAMQWGTANAGKTVQQIGSQAGQLTIGQMRATLKQFSDIVPKKL